ncbi:MAG: TIGR00282 family metallophosphoesterase [Sphaerochaetaceae bacterium]
MSDKKILNALMLGDVCGQPGCRALFVGLRSLVKETHADIVVVNGENAANGFGLSIANMNQFFSLGVDVVTSGNHIWQQEELRPFLDSEPRLLRPANYPAGVVGHGMAIVSTKLGPVVVINVQGRVELPQIDDPFRISQEMIVKAQKQSKVILVDFHAEFTEEKEALGFFLDGKASVVVGTHTHVQTCDEKILPKKTAYITDMGFCGPRESVIGSDPQTAIEKQLSQMPLRSEIADHSPVIQGVLVKIDYESGSALSIERINKNIL